MRKRAMCKQSSYQQKCMKVKENFKECSEEFSHHTVKLNKIPDP
jgi:hypothetical protein